MAERQWYVRFRGRQRGPYGETELFKMVDIGQVSRMHEVSTDGDDWERLMNHAEFSLAFKRRAIPKGGDLPPDGPSEEETRDAAPQPDQDDDLAVENGPRVRQDPAGVHGPALEGASDRAKPLPLSPTMSATEPDDAAQWYYSVGDDQFGPIDEEELLIMIGKGKLPPNVLVWKAGMRAWTPARHAGISRPDLPGLIGSGTPKLKKPESSAIDPFAALIPAGYICSLLPILIFPYGFGAAGVVLALINLLRDKVLHGVIQLVLAGAAIAIGVNFELF